MYSVSPTQTELFHLRLLLLTVKGATSFNDLRTVNGQFYDSFSAICLALGVIEDDDEWKQAKNEAVGWMMPGQLRRLFARILLHCQPLHPKELWEDFKVALSEDYCRYFGILEGQKKAYMQIKRHGSVLRRVHLSSKTRAVSLYARREIETSSDYFILLYYDNR